MVRTRGLYILNALMMYVYCICSAALFNVTIFKIGAWLQVGPLSPCYSMADLSTSCFEDACLFRVRKKNFIFKKFDMYFTYNFRRIFFFNK